MKHGKLREKIWTLEHIIKRLNRRTICFSKNETIHDKVTDLYIETFYYKTGTYENN